MKPLTTPLISMLFLATAVEFAHAQRAAPMQKLQLEELHVYRDKWAPGANKWVANMTRGPTMCGLNVSFAVVGVQKGGTTTPPSDGCPSTCRQSVARVANVSRDVAKMSRAGSRSVAPPSRVGRTAVAVCRAAVAAGRRVARCRGVSRGVKGGSPPVTPPSRSVAPPSRAGRGLSRRRRDLSRRRRGRVATRRIAVAVCRGVSWVSRAIFFLSKPRHVLGHPSEGGVML